MIRPINEVYAQTQPRVLAWKEQRSRKRLLKAAFPLLLIGVGFALLVAWWER